MTARRMSGSSTLLSLALTASLIAAGPSAAQILPLALDGDADGFLDALETVIGSDANDGASTPESVALPPSCLDDVDNDADGQTDLADPGCTAPAPSTETFPGPGLDIFDSTISLESYPFDAGSFGICPITFTARGPVVVERGATVDLGGGLRQFPVEILSMQLTGNAIVGSAPGCDFPETDIQGLVVFEDPDRATLGHVSDTNPDPTRDFPAASSFDVFFQVLTPVGVLPGGPPGGPAGDPVPVENMVDTIPPYQTGASPNCYEVPGEPHDHCPKAPPDHYTCYKARFPKFQKRKVLLADQFDSTGRQVTVVKPVLFCNPASKDAEPLYDETGHLTCYKIKPKKTKRTVLVRNQFGQGTVQTKKSKLLCVPSGKDALADPETLDHFQCYSGKFNRFEPRPVTLVDQWGQLETRVVKRQFLCNPVDKNGEGINDRLNHLECFKLKPPPKVKQTPAVRNQFGEVVVRTKKAVMLCVPSAKFESTTTTTIQQVTTTTTSSDVTTTTTVTEGSTTTTVPGTVTTGVMAGYQHIMPGLSQVCGKITTTPPVPGASASVTLTRPDMSQAFTTVPLDGMGMGPFAFPINQFGQYVVQATVDTPAGPSMGVDTVDVVAADGTCPS